MTVKSFPRVVFPVHDAQYPTRPARTERDVGEPRINKFQIKVKMSVNDVMFILPVLMFGVRLDKTLTTRPEFQCSKDVSREDVPEDPRRKRSCAGWE